jgi:hypothetical protein
MINNENFFKMRLFMKKIFLILFAVATGVFFTSCKSIDGTVYKPTM